MAPPRGERIKTKCDICKEEFEYLYRKDKPPRKLCSNVCKFAYQRNTPPVQRSGKYVTCTECGSSFYNALHQMHRKCCSVTCANLNKTGVPIGGKKTKHKFSFKCLQCSIVVENQQKYRADTAKFCSRSCRAIFYMLTGKKNTKPESQFEYILISNQIEYVKQYQLKNKVYDFYIPSKKMLIEIDGTFWHAKEYKTGTVPLEELYYVQQRVIANDSIKNSIAAEHGLQLTRIWEDEILTFNLDILL